MSNSSASANADAEIEKIFKRLKNNDAELTGIRLKFVFEAHTEKLFKMLTKNKTVQSLSLSGDGVTNKHGKLIYECLSENNTLSYLAIQHCQLGREGVADLAPAFKTNSALKTLILGPSKHNWGLMDPSVFLLAQILAKNTTLTRLDIVSFHIADESAKSLALMLTMNTTLKVLNLSENAITDEGVLSMSRGLKDNKSLRHLVMDNIIAQGPGYQSLVKCLKQYNTTLNRLSLSRNKAVDIKLLQSLCDVFTPSGLNQIDLADCKLTNEDAEVLFEFVTKDKGLKRLQLADNNISSLGSLDLSAANLLTDLDLEGTALTNEQIKTLVKGIRFNRSLTRLNLARTNVLEDGRAALAKEVFFHPTLAKVSVVPGDNGRGLDEAANKILARNEANNTERAKIRQTGFDHSPVPGAAMVSYRGQQTLDVGNLDLSTNEQLEKIIKSAVKNKYDIKIASLYCNRFDTVPLAALQQLNEITELDLSSNRLKELPADLRLLKSIVVLDVRCNQLQTLGIELASMNNLREIHAQNNRLSNVSPKLLANPKITVLKLHGNEFPYPVDILYGQWTSDKVDLSNRNLKALPNETFLLEKVKELYLQDNELTGISQDIGKLQSLEVLDVRNNKLNVLPWQLGTLTKLQKLLLDGNPMNKIPVELRKAPVQKVLEFLLALKSGSEACYRMKIMLVGEEAVGKTSLCNTLRDIYSPQSQAELKKKKSDEEREKQQQQAADSALKTVSTDGIEVHEMHVTTEDSKRIHFSVWDFAGQEVFYPTHSYFLSARSLYLIMFRLYDEIEVSAKRIDYWLQLANYKSDMAPVLLVGTYLDHKRCTKEYLEQLRIALAERYSSRYTNIRGFFAISGRTRKGIKELSGAMLQVALAQPHMGEEIPSSYILLEEQVRIAAQTITPPIIPMDRFEEMASKCGIADRGGVSAVLQFLYHTGTLLYFEGQKGVKKGSSPLENIVVLNPQWLSNIFRSIITFKANFVQNGVLDHRNLVHIWRPPEHPVKMHPVYMSLLEKFEVIFPLRKGYRESASAEFEDKSLVPTFLSEENMTAAELQKAGWVEKGPVLTRVWEFAFLPLGLFSRLMIRVMSVAVTLKYTKSVVIATQDDQKTVALIKAIGSQKISIFVTGKSAAHFLTTLVAAFSNLLTLYPKLKYQVFVVCNCMTCAGSNASGAYLLEDVMDLCTRGEYTIMCEKSSSKIPIDKMAPDLSLAELSNFVVPFTEVQLDAELGKGAFSVVYRGMFKGNKVAIKKKVAPSGEDASKREVQMRHFDDFRAEAWIMKRLVHPCIIQLLGFIRSPLALVLEFAPYGTLYEYLRQGPLDIEQKLKMCCDMARALEFMHSLNPPLMHRDFKSHNCLVVSKKPTDPVMVKLSDFGLTVAGTFCVGREVDNCLWLAIEVMRGLEYTTKVDIYSLGITMWELLTAKDPFSEYGITFLSTLEGQIVDGLRPTVPTDTPAALTKLIRDCWDADPGRRPSAKECISRLDAICQETLKKTFSYPAVGK